jgi:energy-coupling factor transporter ATP-binding protein EcfA2
MNRYMIEVEALTKRYGETRALAGVDFAVPAGTLLGLLGPNGAGKTTAVRVLTTLALPDSGRHPSPLGNPNPSATINAWPMQHPVLASLAWSAFILAVAASSPPGCSDDAPLNNRAQHYDQDTPQATPGSRAEEPGQPPRPGAVVSA